MPVIETALIARAKGLARHLLTREALERLAESDDVGILSRRLAGAAPSIGPLVEPADVFTVEAAAARTAHRHLRTLRRWQDQLRGLLDLFDARQDRRSLRALIRGAATGAAADARLSGLLPTMSLPQRILRDLAHQPSPADVVRGLVVASHPDAPRLLPLIGKSQVDLFAIEVALTRGFAERASRAAACVDRFARTFVSDSIDLLNVETALRMAGQPREIDSRALFVSGGHSLSPSVFASAAASDSPERAATVLTAALAHHWPSSLPPVATQLEDIDRAFLVGALDRLTVAARTDPLSSAPVLKVLLLIEAESRDIRALAWGAQLGVPARFRRQNLVTPS